MASLLPNCSRQRFCAFVVECAFPLLLGDFERLDGLDGGAPRLLRSREGHSAPPTRIRYHGEEKGKFLLSGGLDRAVRATNIVADRQAREMSQRHALKRRKIAHGPDEVERLSPTIGVGSA